ncbi:UDP-N-acetylglucosamine 2-epimerase (hydrolyzing) [Candidatus Woesearchaeota archaeon]|nr:UDP-N-acetylglucosamine 2-epimerase (hydrolyzing) [Candidatus Woesearchaeota archaeon]
MKKTKICVVTGTRAEYGLLRPIIKRLAENDKITLQLIATGMHLLEEYGNTYEDIIKDGFAIDKKVPMTEVGDSGEFMSRSVGKGIINLTNAFKDLNPDIILILGDRTEPLAAAVSGAFMNKVIAHIHGGDVSGGLDECTRHAITKFSHIHFAVTEKSKQRIIKMGENPDYVFNVGSSGLDTALHEELMSKQDFKKRFNIDPDMPFLILLQHPVTTEIGSSGKQFKITLDAIKEFDLPTVLIYPNADSGTLQIIKIIEGNKNQKFLRIFKNLKHREYLSLLKYGSVLIGNSSSGIIEAPSFKIPVVNIGIRQKLRERSNNVIDVEFDKSDIIKAINKALYDENFKDLLKNIKNPYGEGTASVKICKVLSEIKISKDIIQKQICY